MSYSSSYTVEYETSYAGSIMDKKDNTSLFAGTLTGPGDVDTSYVRPTAWTEPASYYVLPSSLSANMPLWETYMITGFSMATPGYYTSDVVFVSGPSHLSQS